MNAGNRNALYLMFYSIIFDPLFKLSITSLKMTTFSCAVNPLMGTGVKMSTALRLQEQSGYSLNLWTSGSGLIGRQCRTSTCIWWNPRGRKLKFLRIAVFLLDTDSASSRSGWSSASRCACNVSPYHWKQWWVYKPLPGLFIYLSGTVRDAYIKFLLLSLKT